MPSSQTTAAVQPPQLPTCTYDTTIYDIRHIKCSNASGREFIGGEKSQSNGNLTRENYMNKSNQSLCSYNALSSDHIVSHKFHYIYYRYN